MNEYIDAFKKLAVAWAGLFYSYLTLDRLAILLTIAYTSVNLFVLVRDKIIRDKRARRETDDQ